MSHRNTPSHSRPSPSVALGRGVSAHGVPATGRPVEPTATKGASVRVFFFKQKTAYEIGLGIPAEPLFRSVLDLTEDDFDFLTSNKVWIATDRSRARRCVEACVYGTLDFVGYPRFPAPVEFIAAVIAY